MESSIPLGDGTRLVIRQHVEVLNTMFDYYNEDDPNWTYTDKGLHFHMAVQRLATGIEYFTTWPTLVRVRDDYWCYDCEDTHGDSHWECRYCGEEIKPGTTRKPQGPVTLAGPQEWTREGELYVTLAESQRMMASGEAIAVRSDRGGRVYVSICEAVTTEERKNELMEQATRYLETVKVRGKGGH